MPSCLPGFFSSGQPLVSGNPWSGRALPLTGITLKVSSAVSGLVFVGWSGGITINSGGALSSGGINDGMEIAAGQFYTMPLPPGGPASIFVTVPATISGTMRIYYQPNFGG